MRWAVASTLTGGLSGRFDVCSVGNSDVVCLVLGLDKLGWSGGSTGAVNLAVDATVLDEASGIASRTA